jgi:hypothetical protein
MSRESPQVTHVGFAKGNYSTKANKYERQKDPNLEIRTRCNACQKLFRVGETYTAFWMEEDGKAFCAGCEPLAQAAWYYRELT